MSELALKLIEKEKQEKTGEIDLGNCGLTEIPEQLFDLVWLIKLNLGNYFFNPDKGLYIKSSNSGPINTITDINKINLFSKIKGLQSLSLNANQISDISFLKELKGLQSLNLSSNQISDYSFLQGLKGLQSLDLWSNQISDISCLQGLKGLQSLNLGANQISDISCLKELKGLQSLNLSFNQISDISFLKELKGLQSLDLWSNQISDISCLQGLKGLQSLNLGANQVSDYTFLQGLKGLQSLNLGANQISDISFLQGLKGLQSLNLSSNQISDISFLKELKGLQSLDLWSNQISDISCLQGLKGLQSLNLGANQVSDYTFLKELKELQSLNLSFNQISDISCLQGLKGLQSLDLWSNQISDISCLQGLKGLQSLNLGANQVSDYTFLQRLKGLQSLNLGANQISDISFLQGLKGLQSLNLSFNQISDISCLQGLKGLQSLDLWSNQISDYSFLKELKGLQSLNLGANQISDISFLQGLKGLQSLNLSSNQISDYSLLQELKGLQSLNLSSNQISDYSFLQGLKGLQSLNLSFNQISDISFLQGLKGLQSLDLSSNQISDISCLQGLKRLQSLDLSSNQISDISPLLNLLSLGMDISIESYELGVILISDNPLSNPPATIVKRGREETLSWFEQRKDGISPLFECKLMILGQGGSGKTTFAELQLDPNYEVIPGKISSTLGIIIHKGKEFCHRKLKGQKIKAHLWDFGGQDIQKMLHQFFITGNCHFVLVSDKRAENTNFDYWFQIVSLLGPESSVIVLENLRDINSNNRGFPINEYTDLYDSLNLETITLNLADTRGKEKIKWQLVNRMIEDKLSELEIVNRPVPIRWKLVRDELETYRSEKYIKKDDFFKKICQKKEIGLTKAQGELCLYYFKELGDLVYFDDTALAAYIFLDHNWLTQGMYYILSDPLIGKSGGRFTRQQAYDYWEKNGYNEIEKSMLIQLLLKDNFDICYELPDEKDVFITPLLLPSDQSSKWGYQTNLHFRYVYRFMPHGLFSRLMVRVHKLIDGQNTWVTGVRLVKGDGTRAEIKNFKDPEGSQSVIDIRIHGEKEPSKQLLEFIRTELMSLHENFKGISYTELVGCNCPNCRKLMSQGKKPFFYPYQRLQSKLKNRKFFESCDNSNYEEVNIGAILNDVIIEDAAENNLNSEFLYRLKQMGVTMTEIINIQSVDNIGNPPVNVNVNACSDAKAISTATNIISIEIQNFLAETDLLKEDISTEKDTLIKKGLEEDEIDLSLKDIEKAKKALSEIDAANNESQEPAAKSTKRLQRFIDDLSNEESYIYKMLKVLRKGRDYGVSLAEGYNKFANNFGMTPVPSLALEVIKKL